MCMRTYSVFTQQWVIQWREKLSPSIPFYVYEAVEAAKWKHIFFVMLNIIYVQAIGSSYRRGMMLVYVLNVRLSFILPHKQQNER